MVRFYDISTIVGYLMPNPIYTHILNIYLEIHFIDNILKHTWDNFFNTSKWFQIFLSNLNNSFYS